MADGIESRTTGIDAVMRRMERLAGTDTFGVQVGAQSTTGSVQRKVGSVNVSRSAGENVIVLRTQEKEGRRFAFLSEQERAGAQDIWHRAVANFMADASGMAVSYLMAGAQALGEYIVGVYRMHLERSIGEGGALAAVKPSTQKQKDRETGKPGLPPLIRTGQLLNMFTAQARKV